MSNSQTYYNFKLVFQKVDEHTGGKWLIHGTKRRKDNQCKAWNSPVEYPSRECKRYVKESESNMFITIFKEKIHEQKYEGSCAFEKQVLLSSRTPKSVVQKVKNGHKNLNSSHNNHDENHDDK